MKAGSNRDAIHAQSVAKAILAEARANRHDVLAERLMDAMGGNGTSPVTAKFVGHAQRHHEFLLELTSRRRIEDLCSPSLTRQARDDLIGEQHPAAVLRPHSLEPRHLALLVGPPGNGKTSLAEAHSGSVGRTVLRGALQSDDRQLARGNRSAPEVGLRLRPHETPCALFFDEFDPLGKERADIHETEEIKRVAADAGRPPPNLSCGRWPPRTVPSSSTGPLAPVPGAPLAHPPLAPRAGRLYHTLPRYSR